MRLPILVALALVSACASSEPDDPSRATVIEVIDGDTVSLEVGDRHEQVRLLGIDTPETKHPTRPVECFGPEAATRTGQLLPAGTIVRLERDTEARDRFGRLLAYVFRAEDGLFVNRVLVEEGFADVLVLAPNRSYEPGFRAAAVDARASGRGLWGACGGPDVPAG